MTLIEIDDLEQKNTNNNINDNKNNNNIKNKQWLTRRNSDAHHVAVMVGEFSELGTGLNVPKNASHVTRRSDNFAIVEEAAARQIASVRAELAANTNRNVTRTKIVNRAVVVKTVNTIVRWMNRQKKREKKKQRKKL